MSLDFDLLIEEHLSGLRAYIASLGVARHLIDDIAQDSFLVAYKKQDKYDGVCAFSTWLFGIAKWEVLKEFRRTKINSKAIKGKTAERLLNSDFEAGDPENYFLKKESLFVLRQCISRLSQKVQNILALRFDSRLKLSEIGIQVSMKSSTVSMTLVRANQALRVCIDNKLGERKL